MADGEGVEDFCCRASEDFLNVGTLGLETLGSLGALLAEKIACLSWLSKVWLLTC